MVRAGFALLVMMLLIGTGCNTPERISKLEKKNQELQEEVNRRQAAVDYDLQAKCSRDAKQWFKENWSTTDKTTILLDFTNHYNKRLNKCFISVEYHYSLGGDASWTNHISLWDVYENARYANFSENHMVFYKPEIRTRDNVLSCEVVDNKCKTLDEFNGLTADYMNN
jgi:hypothetical protein